MRPPQEILVADRKCSAPTRNNQMRLRQAACSCTHVGPRPPQSRWYGLTAVEASITGSNDQSTIGVAQEGFANDRPAGKRTCCHQVNTKNQRLVRRRQVL